MIKSIALMLFIFLLGLGGCASPEYACGVPGGIGCKPLHKVQKMAEDGVLKSQPVPANRDTEDQDYDEDDDEIFTTDEPFPSWVPDRTLPKLETVTAGAPLLIPPRTMRVWINRWTDDGGTLHDETYLYLRLDNGHWIIERS